MGSGRLMQSPSQAMPNNVLALMPEPDSPLQRVRHKVGKAA